jgi:glycosyltransferase involved in cell wall biosynthesis
MGRLVDAHKPRLLFLCQTLPYPPDGGVWIRSYHVLRLLSRTFDVTALCFERSQSSGTGTVHDVRESVDALGRFAAVETFAIPQKGDRVRFAWDHLRSATLGRVYTEYLYDSRDFRDRLQELLDSHSFDIVHMDSLVDFAAYLPLCDGMNVVCVHHAVESALLRSRAAVEAKPWRRGYLRYQARLMEACEREWCGRVSLNVAVSSADGADLQRLAPTSRVAVVPNGVDVDEFRPVADEGIGVAFIGGLNWFPNRDALDFYCESILPHLEAAGLTVSAKWIGQASAEERARYRARYGVELTGYVDDVRPHMWQARCHVVPLRAGGGTRLKILNSWAMGKPVVSTSLGCEGLEAVDGDNILIRDDPKAFADAVGDVLTNDALRGHLGDRGRKTAETRYSWDGIGEQMISTYLALINDSRRAHSA